MQEIIKLSLFYLFYFLIYKLSFAILYKKSRWFRWIVINEINGQPQSPEENSKFVCSYITRIIWAIQATATSCFILYSRFTGEGYLTAEVNDKIYGWSNDFEQWAYPSTVAFALFENWLEYEDFVLENIKLFLGINNKKKKQLQRVNFKPNPLMIHHMLFLLVELYSYKTQTIAYFTNLVKLYELTAPFSFLRWLVKSRHDWFQKVKLQDDKHSTPLLASYSAVIIFSKIRLFIWILCRFCVDSFLLFELFTSGFMPCFVYDCLGFSDFCNNNQMSFGNKIQLWLFSPTFVIYLHPYWFYMMIKSHKKLFLEKSKQKKSDRINDIVLSNIPIS